MNFWADLPRPFTALAPMEDVTDTVFRGLIADLGAPDVFFTEFLNATELMKTTRRFARQRVVVDSTETFRPLVAQISGNSPEDYRTAVGQLLELGFSGIDINMGCPAVKVVRRGSCAGLIDNPSLAKELILAAREAAGEKPVSVKTRLGVKSKKTEAWAGFLLELDLPALAIHGRTALQMSEGEADWQAIARVVGLRDEMKKTTRILGNGDLFSVDDLDRRFRETSVDGLMVGRGIFRDPLIFRKQRPHRPFGELPRGEKILVMERHIREHHRVWGGKKGYDMLKSFYKIYSAGFDGAGELLNRLFQSRSHEEGLAIVREAQKSSLVGNSVKEA